MASGVSIEVLDLRHFAATPLRPLLEAESELWRDRLHWDYRPSIKLLNQYLDNRALPGFVALDCGQIVGYAFCVYEESKAVIGDIFALPTRRNGNSILFDSPEETEETLLRHLLEMLLNSPNVDRVESQLLLAPSGFQARSFRDAGFQTHRRLFMVQSLDEVWHEPRVDLPRDLELRPWRDEDLNPAARLICEAYRDHADGIVNDQYRTEQGSLRFLHNIVRYSGCGVFSPQVSHVVADRQSRELVALVLGSRVSTRSGHITQICVHPDRRRCGLGRLLLSIAALRFKRQGASEISLTVTESNVDAIDLYKSEGYTSEHSFDASVWQRKQLG
jgi:ribosomal protein S18 acetylase RimI-like enzyme